MHSLLYSSVHSAQIIIPTSAQIIRDIAWIILGILDRAGLYAEDGALEHVQCAIVQLCSLTVEVEVEVGACALLL